LGEKVTKTQRVRKNEKEETDMGERRNETPGSTARGEKCKRRGLENGLKRRW
jgi:hypothetical protein